MNKNKGFSLVELIVVVAIMAVLVGILAPAYLSYVEKTRRGTDENMAEEIRHTVEISAADICVYDELKGGLNVTLGNGDSITDIANGKNAFLEAITDTYGSKTFAIKSKKYANKGYTITVQQSSNGSGAALDVNGSWN